MTAPRLALTALALALASPPAARAAVWPVSEDAKLQETIDTAAYGDTVLVAPGTYVTATLRSGVRLISEKGPEETLLQHTSYWVIHGEAVDSLASVEGFTLDGNKSADGVVLAEECFFTVRNCILRGGWSGVRAVYGALRVEGCTIRECQNGIYMFESGGYVADCDIQLCVTGATIISSNPRLVRNTITRNSVGIYVQKHSDPLIGGAVVSANRIWNNAANAIRNDSYLKRDGIRTWKPMTLKVPFNFWGSDCPDSSLFRGSVEFVPWVDESGTRSLESCAEKPAKG
jgi:parallel beta-helix repeat protein